MVSAEEEERDWSGAGSGGGGWWGFSFIHRHLSLLRRASPPRQMRMAVAQRSMTTTTLGEKKGTDGLPGILKN
eukprot:CAMPEP_0183318628 /NCGR_PEP_ID=MMETSP0160_2-20130417/61296_1 /TAXON_ID=2839 ORGANISM="Odontella Sinensis, Strain Grunow 1884" /NCGR_SAMPLE_ID=MMETSP0160_2 /ASSEMBLY_ACC=CAM_ASM_000250 /LENGTH=72 /DNA_ID=CAMNT_0025484947 /DNA_START=90 /DNA_END=305 /DNA_ORIENTATION=+